MARVGGVLVESVLEIHPEKTAALGLAGVRSTFTVPRAMLKLASRATTRLRM